MKKFLTILSFLLIGSVANAGQITDILNEQLDAVKDTTPMVLQQDNLTLSEINLISDNINECVNPSNIDTKIPSITYEIEFNKDGSVSKLVNTNPFDYGVSNYEEIVSLVSDSIKNCKVIANPGKHNSWKVVHLTIDLGL